MIYLFLKVNRLQFAEKEKPLIITTLFLTQKKSQKKGYNTVLELSKFLPLYILFVQPYYKYTNVSKKYIANTTG